ncbi:MAG: hypothetical protein AABX14_02335 [Candidatus Aenigmatarchaeota archaeon]
MRKSSDAIIQLRQSLADIKKGRIKKTEFVPLDFNLPENCYLCKKKERLCKCVECKVCSTLLKKSQTCTFCKKKNTVKNFSINNAELNMLEDICMTDLKVMFKLKRDKEVEEWQDRCRDVWHRLVRKIDRP